jgi:lipopolysaccharide transport system ATP-binding protein
MSDGMAIRAEGLGKRFEHGTDGHTETFWALRDVSFEVRKGENIGIIGPNGSGKSTLLKILAGVTRPTEGRVEVNGRVASILEIGSGFHPDLSGRENIFLNGSILGFTRGEIAPHVEDIIAFSGIADFMDDPVKNYSSGMYVRLAFSIMAHLPFDIYLLDEVMAVGDAEFSLRALDAIGRLSERGCTLLFVSHALTETESRADRMIYLRGGRVTDVGSKDLLKRYLADGTDRMFHFENGEFAHIMDAEKAFLKAGIVLRDAKVIPEQQHPEGIPLTSAFTLSIKADFRSGERLDIFAVLTDASGIPLFHGSTLNEEGDVLSAGIHAITFRFPADLLNDRFYLLKLIISKSGAAVVKLDRFATIRMVDPAKTREFPTLMRPNVQVTVQSERG